MSVTRPSLEGFIKLSAAFPDLDLNWLLKGGGEMFIVEEQGREHRLVLLQVEQEKLQEEQEKLTIFLTAFYGFNLFRRLNSYARLNPLHKALNDLGRIYSTLYIVKYIGQPEIAESVEGIMSKVEHANKFAKAITLGNNQDFNWATHYEQHLAEGCKRLIMNAINYYNLLLLSEKVNACTNQVERNELLALIARSSTHTWQHINLQGEFDFTENEQLPEFDMNAILNLSL